MKNALAVLVMFFAVNALAAQVVYVNASAGDLQEGTRENPYRTIQDGIDNVEANGLVVVAPGTYSGFNVSDKPVRIYSSGCAANTIVNTEGGGSVRITVGESAAGTVISGLTFRGSFNVSPLMRLDGSAAIRNCIFTKSEIEDADVSVESVIYVGGVSTLVRMENCLVYGNQIINFAPMVYVESGCSIELDHCTIAKNIAAHVGLAAGILLGTGATLECRDSIVFGNRSSGYNSYNWEVAGDWFAVSGGGCNANLQYSCIDTTDSNIDVSTTAIIYDDPCFTDPNNGDFSLADYSPCLTASSSGGAIGCIMEKLNTAPSAEGFTYEVDGSTGGATITRVPSSMTGHVTLPTSIDGYVVTGLRGREHTAPEGYFVISIESIFEDPEAVTGVELPATLRRLGANAFYGCTSLTSISIPNGVESVDLEAFRKCTNLAEIEIPASVSYIGAFRYSVDKRDEDIIDAFSARIIVDEGNQWYSSDAAGALYDKGKTRLIRVAGQNTYNDSFYTIPNTVESMAANAFAGVKMPYGMYLTIPASLTNIETYAFAGASDLYVKEIAEDNPRYSLNGSDGKTIYSKDKMTLYHHLGSSWLTQHFTIPDSVTNIAHYAFSGCLGMTGVTIPDSVASMGNYGFEFSACPDLVEVTLPKNVEKIVRTFAHCYNLRRVVMPRGSKIKRFSDGVFQYCTNLTEVVLSEGVEFMGDSVFWHCTSLHELTVPESVTYFGGIKECYSLTNVSFRGPPPDSSQSYLNTGCPDTVGYYRPKYASEWQAVLDENGKWYGKIPMYERAMTNEVMFVIGEHGSRTGGGELVQSVLDCESAVAPVVAAADGWEFTGWDVSLDNVMSNLTITAQYVFGHDAVETKAAQEPTCTADGWSHEVICSRCHEVLETSAPIPALGHVEGEGSVVREATIFEAGEMAYSCSRCGAVLRSESIPTLPSVGCGEGFDSFTQLTNSIGGGVTIALNGNSVSADGDSISVGENGVYVGFSSGTDKITVVVECEGLTASDVAQRALFMTYVINTDRNKNEPVFNREGVNITSSGALHGVWCNDTWRDPVGEMPLDGERMFLVFIYDRDDGGVSLFVVKEGVCQLLYLNGKLKSIYDSIQGVMIGGSMTTSFSPCTGMVIHSLAVLTGNKTGSNINLGEDETIAIPARDGTLAFEQDGTVWKYVVVENKATIRGVINASDKLRIPETIAGFPATAIGARAIADNDSITSVVIHDSITDIGYDAFSGCSNLASVVFLGNAPKVGSSTLFSGVADGCAAYVPRDSTGWGVTIPGTWKGIRIEYVSCQHGGETEVWNATDPTCTEDGYTGDTVCCICGETLETGDVIPALGHVEGEGVVTQAATSTEDGVRTYYCTRCGEVVRTEVIPAPTWHIDENGVLTGVELNGFEEVTIPDSVTSIGIRAFYGCTNLTSVTIPSSVTDIGDSAFSGCYCLTSITIPDSVTSIGNYAFSSCRGLMSLTIPDGVTSIGNEAFMRCPNLTSVTIPNSVTNIGVYAFCMCSRLMSVTIPDGVTVIEYGAFQTCPRLTSVTIPDSVTSIGERAFCGCTGLTNVTIPDSVTSIANEAFNSCRRLTSVTIPDSVTSIGEYAFLGCSGLTSITIGDSVTGISHAAFFGCSGLTSVTIPDSVTSIGDSAFEGCEGLTSVTIGNGVTNIGACAFAACEGLTSVTIPDSVTSIGVYAFFCCSGLTGVTIPASVTNISHSAFECCSSLTSVTFLGDAPNVGEDAFAQVSAGCTAYVDADAAGFDLDGSGKWNGLAVVRRKATYTVTFDASGGEGGTSVTQDYGTAIVAPTVTRRGYTFAGWSPEVAATVPAEDVTYTAQWEVIETPCLYTVANGEITITGLADGYAGDLTIPSYIGDYPVTSIGNSAFSGCSGLTSVTIPDSVTSIGDHAFAGCSGLTSVTIPLSVTSVEDYAFSACSGLTSVTIGNSVTDIGCYAFSGCSGLTSVTIPDSVWTISWGAFAGCSGLTSVTIGSGVKNIDDDAFAGCRGPTCIVFNGDAPYIEAPFDNTFEGVIYVHRGSTGWSSTGWRWWHVEYLPCAHDGTTSVQGATEPTCTEPGYTGDTVCDICGEILEVGSSVEALGHVEVETKSAQSPTCKEDGWTHEVTCSRCSEVLAASVAVPMLGHTPVETKASQEATCTEAGWTHEVTCSRCNEVLEPSAVLYALGHVEAETKAAQAATCTEDGWTHEVSCSRCNEVLEASTPVPKLGHVEVETKAAKAETCTEDGWTHEVSCSRCNVILEASTVLPKLGHVEVETKDAKAATCTEDGWTHEVTCSRCSEVLAASVAVPMLGHTPVETKASQAATCTEAGWTHEMTCSRCNEVLEPSAVLYALGHVEVETKAAQAPTCTEDGWTHEVTCSRCHEVLEASMTISALGHIEGDGVVTKEATTEVEGEITYYCTRCGDVVRTDVIPAKVPVPTEGIVTYYPLDGGVNDASWHGFNLTNNGAGLCYDRFGNLNSAYWFDGAAYLTRDHNGAPVVPSGSFTFACWVKPEGFLETASETTSGMSMLFDAHPLVVNPAGAQDGGSTGTGLAVGYNGIAVIEAASSYYAPTLLYTGDFSNKWIHVVITVNDNSAPMLYLNGIYVKTGLQNGRSKALGVYNVGGVVLEDNNWDYHRNFTGALDDLRVYNRALSAGEVMALYEHVPCLHNGESELMGELTATCTEDGYTGDTVCCLCGDVLAAGETIPALGHDPVEMKVAQSATCTEAGWTHEVSCSHCGEVLEASENIPALGHDPVETSVAQDPTCTADGWTREMTCSRCSDILERSTVLPKLGHVETITKGRVEPTCTVPGSTEEMCCSRCNEVLTASLVLPALGHNPVETKAAKAATCTEDGWTHEVACERCHEVLEASESVPALGHEMGEVVVTKEATVAEEGVRTYYCIHCGEILKTEWIVSPNWNIDANGVLKKVKLDGATAVTIPHNVTSIGKYAFYNCSGLLSVTIPDGVTTIEESAFYNCSALTSIAIPDSVTVIGDSAFSDCRALESVMIGNSVTRIEDWAFYNCSKLRYVAIPDSVAYIGNNAFLACASLESISIGRGLSDMGAYNPFSRCSALHSITVSDENESYSSVNGLLLSKDGSSVYTGVNGDVVIPDGVTSIEMYAFYGCNALMSVTMPNGVASIGEAAFFGCEGLSCVDIPDSVTSIGRCAFEWCSGLSEVSIPANVTSLGEYVFAYCEGLTNVMFEGNAPAVGDNAFYGLADGCVAYVPYGSTGWGVDIPGSWNGIRIEYAPCDHNGEIEVINNADPTCTADGYTGDTVCCICGEVLAVGDAIAALGHDEKETTSERKPTCTEDGWTHEVTCERCGEVLEVSVPISALGHVEVETKAAQAATCTEAGWTHEMSCSRCNEVLEASVTIPALGHDPVETMAAQEPTCLMDGWTREMNCSRCSEILEQSTVLPKLGHVETTTKARVEPTCTVPGSTEEICCSRCNEVLAASLALPALGHVDVETKVAQAPTCTEDGWTHEMSCSRCNEVLEASETIYALGHTPVETKTAQTATCTEAGWTHEISCSSCSEVLEASMTIPALGHNSVETKVAQEPTCTEDGWTREVKCSVCHEVLEVSEIIPALGHIEVETMADQDPTCTADGWTHEVGCDRCHAVLEASESISALDHVEVETKVAQAATCTEAGWTHEMSCSRCHEVLEASTAIPALGHNSVETKAAQAATCTEEGRTHEVSCSRCHEVLEVSNTISALGHVEGEGVVTKEATTEEEGEITYYCTRCDAIIRVETTERLPKQDFEPPTWTPVHKGDTMLVYATVFDRSIQSAVEAEGSLLAAFAADGECRGVAEIDQGPRGKLFQLSVGLEVTTESGIVLKVWNAADGKVTEIAERIAGTSSNQIGQIFEPRTFNIGAVEMAVSLKPGWNWISTYLVLDDPSVGAVFANCTFANGDVVKTVGKSSTYYAGKWYPASFTIEPGVAYIVKKSAGDVEPVEFSGTAMQDGITVTKGWNWIGATLAEAQGVSSAYHSGGFGNEDIIKSVNASTTYYDGVWYPGTFEIAPGVGYKAKFANSGTLRFSGAEAPKRSLAKGGMRLMAATGGVRSSMPDWMPVSQEDSAVAYLKVKRSEGDCFFEVEGSIIAAFSADGECRGVGEIADYDELGKQYQLSISVKSATESGFMLKLWDAESGKIYDIAGTLSSNANLQIGEIFEPVVLSLKQETPLPEVADDGEVADALSTLADANLTAIVTTATEYTNFCNWAQTVVAGGVTAVRDSERAAVSYMLGATTLFENEPTITISDVEVGKAEGESVDDGASMTLSVTVKDGEDVVAVTTEKVAKMFEATSDIGDWDGDAKLTPMVEILEGKDNTLRFKVKPGDGKSPSAFLRIRK